MIFVLLTYLISSYHTQDLWKDPDYVVTSKEELCLNLDIDIAEEVISSTTREELKIYFDDFFNELTRIFAWHNIGLRLRQLSFWDYGNQIKMADTMEEIASNYKLYVNDLYNSGSIHLLLINVETTDKPLGKGFLDGVCTKNAYAVIQSGNRTGWNPVYTAEIAAHEIGHVLGFQHVDESNTTCNCAWGKYCIMNPTSFYWTESIPHSFDSCSMKQLLSSAPSCLQECSTKIYTYNTPFCGNNIVEKGEQCDCGFAEACELTDRLKCCDPNTCRFVDTSYTCDRGECCSDCKYLRGTQCRTATGDCDIPGFCPGNKAYCPRNQKIDGTKCSNDQAYCIFGVCQTKDQYCKDLFPNSDVQYSQECYDFAQTYANRNCFGLSSKTLTNLFCGTGKGICGQIYCTGTFNDPYYRFSSGNLACYTVLDSPESEYINKVPLGGVCGPNEICYESVCSPDTKIMSSCSTQCRLYEECSNTKNQCVPNDIRWFDTYNEIPW